MSKKSKRIKELVAEIAGASIALGTMVPNGDRTIKYIMDRLEEIVDISENDKKKLKCNDTKRA